MRSRCSFRRLLLPHFFCLCRVSLHSSFPLSWLASVVSAGEDCRPEFLNIIQRSADRFIGFAVMLEGREGIVMAKVVALTRGCSGRLRRR